MSIVLLHLNAGGGLGPRPTLRQPGRVKPVPYRIDNGAEKGGMPLEFLRGSHVRPGRPDLDDDRITRGTRRQHRRRRGAQARQRQADLAAAGELDIDLAEQLGVDQRAMFDANARSMP